MSIHKLIQALRDNMKVAQTLSIMPAVVKSVEESSCTVNLLSNDMELDKVQYTASELNENGFRLIPKVGCNCIIALIGSGMNSIYLLTSDELDRVELKCATSTIAIDSEGIIMNDGDNGGLVISSTIAEELNGIKTDINNLKTVLAAWVPTPNDGGAALKAALAVYFADILSPTMHLDLENPDIKH